MKKRKRDVVELLRKFQFSVLSKKPPLAAMINDVRMMRFKIRPVKGNVDMLNTQHPKVLEVLWSLGKLDEFVRSNREAVGEDQEGLLMQFFDEMHNRLQADLNLFGVQGRSSGELEMEVYTDRPPHKTQN